MTEIITSRTYLLLEMIALYLILPLLIYLWSPEVLLPLLWILAVICYVILLKEKRFKRSTFWALPVLIHYKVIFLQATTVFLFTATSLYLLAPELLFSLIKTDPLLCCLVVLLYPLLSAYPQELIYRGFFFYRYRTLLTYPSLSIALNGLLFGYMHMVFHNWIAVILTTLGGFYFALLYQRSHSILFVSIVHAIYGNLIFILGLGHYFYHGSIETISIYLRF